MNKDKIFDFNKTENIVNEFVKKIYDLDKEKKTLDEKLSSINILLDNLIDYCIKKKIFYYVENKISYTNITISFKTHLIKYIKNLIDPSDNIINKYIINNTTIGKNTCQNVNQNTSSGWDNVSDINSLMFKNYKNLNESFEKNVSFGDNFQITNYDEGNEGFEYNVKSHSSKLIGVNTNLLKNVQNDNEENIPDIKNLSLYIKILVNQNKYLVEFVDRVNKMCKILSDPEIKYKKSNPFD